MDKSSLEDNDIKINKNYKSINFSSRIQFLILHNTDISFSETIDKFTKGVLSAHYVIDKDGSVYQLVSLEDTAFHAGVSSWHRYDWLSLNNVSIGVEIVNSGTEDFTTDQYDSVIKLSKMLMKKYNISENRIISHRDISPSRKVDVSGYFDWHRYYIGIGANIAKVFDGDLPEGYAETLFSLQAAGRYDDEVKKIQEQLQKFGYPTHITGYFDYETQLYMGAFNQHFCPEVFIKESPKDPKNNHIYVLSQYRMEKLTYNP